MTTRASLARGQGQQHFEGRVRRWEKRLTPATPGAVHGLWLLKWQATDRSEERSRFPHLVPVEQPLQLKDGRAAGLKRQTNQALDSKVPQPAKPAVAYTEPPAKRIRFQDDATGRLSADAPSSTPGEAGTTELHRLAPSSEPPVLEPAFARHLAQVSPETSADQGPAVINDTHMGASGRNQDASQPADTANGVASDAAHDLKEQQPEPRPQPSELQHGMDIDSAAPS